MTSSELRKKYLDFFERNGHKVIPSASLIPSEEEQLAGKEKVLFTSAGMQPIIPFLSGEKEPPATKLVDVQKCLRTDDIEEVGDSTHHTFFEMLGNWSIGDYWKKEAIELSFKFLTEELGLPLDKLAVSVFSGDDDAPKDQESAQVWEDLGVPKERISYLGKEHNWWPTSTVDENGNYINATGLCGPDTEMFYWTGEGEPVEKPEDNPLWVEIWNVVFMQFNRKDDGILEELKQKNVDTGMGFERTLAALNGVKSAYETDLFLPIIEEVCEKLNVKYGQDEKVTESLRIIADHIKAATFLIADGVVPSNKLQGYVLRRLIRRAAVKLHQIDSKALEGLPQLVKFVIEIYTGTDYFANSSEEQIKQIVLDEIKRFQITLNKGLTEIEKMESVSGKQAFNLYQSYGFPAELTEELLKEKGLDFDKEEFRQEFEKHRELSRSASAGMFKGGLAGQGEIETKYHSATHLLHQALRDVLGVSVFQKGSNITRERLRFDFNFDRKLTDEEIKKTEDIVNKRIKEDLVVNHKMMKLDEAKKMNAIGLFNEKYAEEVSIYAIGPDYTIDPEAKDQRNRGGYYSAEFCGGPHVEHAGVIGGIKIIKEEAISQGVRRIRAELI